MINNMQKFLLAVVLVLPMVLAGCSSSESKARKEISDRVDTFKKENVSYSIGKCIYAADNDSCFIFEGNVTSPDVNYTTEYLYRQYSSDLLIGIKLVTPTSGSLLRNINIKANTGSEVDIAANEAFESSGLGLSMTIYNDLKNGSLLDITNIDKLKSIQPAMSNKSVTIKEIGTDSVEVTVK